MEGDGGTTNNDAASIATGCLAALALYMGVVQLLRFRRIRRMKRSLDAIADASEVVRQMSSLEFPFVMSKALEFALFATYGVPSISKLLDKTGEFRKSVGKRYEDTDLIIREYQESGVGGARSQAALARLNAIHGMYAKEISNADMLFTLSLFITEPAAWVNRYGWRRCTDFEKEALLVHFGGMGKGMGIKGVEAWKTWDDVNDFQAAYAREHFRYAASNAAIGGVTIDLFVSLLPKRLQSSARWGVYALIDPPLLKAMGFPKAPFLLEWILKGSLLLRAAAIRFLLPPRPEFLAVRRTPLSDAPDDKAAEVVLQPTFHPFQDPHLGCLCYQNGYKIGELGPATCPAGRMWEGASPPTYTGKGGGGSGGVVCGADGSSPLARGGVAAAASNAAAVASPVPTEKADAPGGKETKKSA